MLFFKITFIYAFFTHEETFLLWQCLMPHTFFSFISWRLLFLPNSSSYFFAAGYIGKREYRANATRKPKSQSKFLGLVKYNVLNINTAIRLQGVLISPYWNRQIARKCLKTILQNVAVTKWKLSIFCPQPFSLNVPDLCDNVNNGNALLSDVLRTTLNAQQ